MRAYLARRLFLLVPTLFGVTFATFLMLRLTPGDPVQIMLGEFASRERVIELRRELGLDLPLAVQYLRFAERVARGDLGTSIRSRRAVADEIRDRLPATVTLTLAAMALAVCLGVPIGIAAATTSRPTVDSAAMAFALLGLSMPTFWSGLLLILLFSLRLGWFPITQAEGLRALVLPAAALAAPASAVLARITRSSMLEVLRHEYIRTARSKGLAERLVVYRHALRNALIPVFTIVGLQFGGQLAGAVIVESVFARPGLGRLAVNAILARDFPVVQGIVLVVALMYVFVNLTVDVLYAGLDPRIRYR
jgi:ABC-type dipeptide/oligopeptide/nickel transport system permease component